LSIVPSIINNEGSLEDLSKNSKNTNEIIGIVSSSSSFFNKIFTLTLMNVVKVKYIPSFYVFT